MKIAVIDTDAEFRHKFFEEKKYTIKKWNPGYQLDSTDFPFSHAEYVCACIWLENPEAEIVLYNIIGNQKRKGQLLYNSLSEIMSENIVDIVNVSAGVEIEFPQELYDICHINSRIRIVSAHANSGKISYPAAFDNVIGVKKGNTKSCFFMFDKHTNNLIIDKSAYLSLKQLEQEHLMQGNSLFAATFTGIISKLYNTNITIENMLCNLQKNELNQKVNTNENNSLNTLVISNRKVDKEQIKFCESYFQYYEIMDINEVMYRTVPEKSKFLFIDIDDYRVFTQKKYNLINFVIKYKYKFKKFFIRYPFFSYAERMLLLTSERILIEQLYI